MGSIAISFPEPAVSPGQHRETRDSGVTEFFEPIDWFQRNNETGNEPKENAQFLLS